MIRCGMSNMDKPPMTDGERMVWAAAYAASWAMLREFKRKHGGAPDNHGLADNAADEAWGALHELRMLASGEVESDSQDDAKAVIGGEG